MSSSQSKDNLVHQVKLSPNGKLLAISTPERVSIYSTNQNESNLKASIKTLILPDPPRSDPTLDPSSSQPLIAFPRCMAFSPDSNRLAITGDDKSIRIWDLSQVKDGELVGFGYGNQILHQNIPKRASMIGWEGNETIIVADKFGDVRSFTIGSAPASAPARQKSSEQPPAKKAKTEQSEIEEEEEGEEEEALDSSLKPHLGHVSFLTSFVLAGKSPKDSSPRHILTADRDGHIRVSRWGSRKAAWVTENFLLGSRGCVGSILLIPSSSVNDENLLLSSDGGSSLNLWNYVAPAGKKQRISTCIIKDALIDHIAVCPEREKCKENRKLDENGRFKGSNKKSGRVKSQENGTSNEETTKVESEEIVDPKRAKDLVAIKSAKQDLGRVITSLRSFRSKTGETFILFTAEGSTSFFHLPLSSILEISSSTDFASPIIPEKDLSSLVVATETGAPILSLDLTESSQDGSIKVWTASDTRKGARLSKEGIRNELWKKVEGDGGELEIQSLGLDCFDFDGKKFNKMDSSSETPEGSILRSVHELTRESREATYGASTLDLYPALLWPKLSPEIHNLQWTIQNDEASKKGKGTKPKFNKQKMRDGHKEVIETGRKWLEERKA